MKATRHRRAMLGRRARRDLDEHELQVLLGEDDRAPTSIEVVKNEPAVLLDPDEYGIRVDHLNERERLEAAEFLVATRIRQDVRIRVSERLQQCRQRRAQGIR